MLSHDEILYISLTGSRLLSTQNDIESLCCKPNKYSFLWMFTAFMYLTEWLKDVNEQTLRTHSKQNYFHLVHIYREHFFPQFKYNRPKFMAAWHAILLLKSSFKLMLTKHLTLVMTPVCSRYSAGTWHGPPQPQGKQECVREVSWDSLLSVCLTLLCLLHSFSDATALLRHLTPPETSQPKQTISRIHFCMLIQVV